MSRAAAGPQGPHSLVERLTSQVGDAELATALLKARGHMNEDGTLTETGAARDAMSAEERAIDRARKRSKTTFGQLSPNFTYNPLTNKVRRR